MDWASALFGFGGVIIGAVVSYLASRQAAQKTFDAAKLTVDANERVAELEREEAAIREYRANKKEQYDHLARELATLSSRVHGLHNSTPYLNATEIINEADGISRQFKTVNSNYAVYADQELRDALNFASGLVGFLRGPVNGRDRATYALLSWHDDGFRWDSTIDLSPAEHRRSVMTNALVFWNMFEWCIARISFEMGYNKGQPEIFKPTFIIEPTNT